MDFLEVIEQAKAVLRSKGRVTYRTLKRQFALDDDALDDLKDELLFSDPLITEVDGRGLVWNGADSAVDYHFIRGAGSFDLDTASLVPGHMTVRGMRQWLKNITSQETSKGTRYTVDESIENGTVMLGSPESVVAQIKRQREEGKRGTLLAMFQFGNLDGELATQNLGLFASEVLPKIRTV